LGKAGYALLQALLLWMCLLWLGGVLRPAVVFAVFAAERVLSLAVVTPGATGVVEIGMTGMLVAFGVDPATAAAGVLLYRAVVVGLEIPVGGLAMLWWVLHLRTSQRRPRLAPDPLG
jgi:putative heme transporter